MLYCSCFTRSTLAGSTAVIWRWQGSVFTSRLSLHLTSNRPRYLPCVPAHPRTVVGPSSGRSSSPARGCLRANANHQIPLPCCLLVESLEGYGLPLLVPDTCTRAQLLLLPCVTSSGDSMQIVCVQQRVQTLLASSFSFRQ